jgi:hypothetical protein
MASLFDALPTANGSPVAVVLVGFRTTNIENPEFSAEKSEGKLKY